MSTMSVIILFPLLLLYIAIPTGLLSVLEYFLARMETPWPGRVLPILSAVNALCWALIVLLNMIGPASPSLFLVPLAILVVFNIPTLVFLAVYRITRRGFIERRNMERRDIQDL